MNLVHLIGEIHSSPELHLLSNGRRQVKFTLTTQESYLDAEGTKKTRKNNQTRVSTTTGEKESKGGALFCCSLSVE